jgi:type I site-specific restriction endonuclease
MIIINCRQYLTDRAIDKSLLVQSLQQKIKVTEEQINYLNSEIEHYKSRGWIDYITLKPLEIIENLFGGGKARETKLRIIDLETKVGELKDNKSHLENQLIITKEEIKNEMTIVLINIQEAKSQIKLIEEKIKKTNLKNKIFAIQYRYGEGTTEQYLNYQDNIDKLDFDLLKATNDYNQNISKLLLLVD